MRVVGRLGQAPRNGVISARAAVAYAMARPLEYLAATEPWRSRRPITPEPTRNEKSEMENGNIYTRRKGRR